MGLCNAGDLFESALCELLSGLPGVTNIADDILVYGSTQEEHDDVICFLEWCLEINLHLNPNKVKINCTSLPFFGMVLTESGIKPDPTKVEVIHNWSTPKNITELLWFLGSVNYLSQFILELSCLRKPFQTLVKKDSEFVWTAEHDRAFAEVKLAVSKDCLLFYDPQKPLYIECDASKQGIGCVLL